MRSPNASPSSSQLDFAETIPEESAVRRVLDNVAHLLILPERLTFLNGPPVGGDTYSVVVLAKLDESSQIRDVAVKQLRTTEIRGSNRLRIAMRLARQVKVWESLSHANVLELLGYYLSPTYDVAQLISPYLRNRDLEEYMQQTSVGIAQRIIFVRDMAAGLDYLHTRRPPICHGNLKPSNILIDDNLNVVLSGFGLAKVYGDSNPSDLTTTDNVMGTSRYMSPELWVQEDGKQTLASDVWAWGCTAFQIITDKLPFSESKGHSGVILAIIRRDPPGQPSVLLNLVPNALRSEHASTLRLLHSYLPLCWEYEPKKRPSVSQLQRQVFMDFVEEDAGDSLAATLDELAHLLIPPDRLRLHTESHLSSGIYGEVVLGTLDQSSANPMAVAAKRLKTAGSLGENARLSQRLSRELKIWGKVKHQNVLGLIGYYLDEKFETPLLISPYMVNGNVLDYINRFNPEMGQRIAFVKGITAGLAYLHGHQPAICHADLKPANVLLDSHLDAVLCDFGLATFVKGSEAPRGSGTTTLKGTPRYMSPELLLDDEPKHTLESDVWAWGCTVFQLLTGRIPYAEAAGEAPFFMVISQGKRPGDINLLLPRNPQDLDSEPALALRVLYSALPQCWDIAPTSRPSIYTLLSKLSDLTSQNDADGDLADEASPKKDVGERAEDGSAQADHHHVPTEALTIRAPPFSTLTLGAVCLLVLGAIAHQFLQKVNSPSSHA